MTFAESIGWPLRAIALQAGKGISGLWHKVGTEIVAWNEAARLRHLARSMDERTLRDIGLSRADLEVSAGKLRQWRYY